MKNKEYIRFVVVFIMMLFTPIFAGAETITYTATYDYNRLTIGTCTLGGQTYTTLHYADLSYDGEPGLPLLPIDIIHFSVPYNASNFTVFAHASDYYQQAISYPVYPSQFPKTLLDTTESITPPDSVIYVTGLYPSSSSMAWVIDDDYLAGENHIVTVAVMPIGIRYRNSGYQLKLNNTINLSLYYTICNTPSEYPLICRDAEKRSEGHKLTKSIVVNPSAVIANAPSSNMNGNLLAGNNIPTLPGYLVDSLDRLNTDVRLFDYLIITTDSLSPSLKRLSALKKQKGYKVGIVTVDEIVHNPLIDVNRLVTDELIEDTVDYPTIIRLVLTYAYVYGKAKYVLLVGRDVPFYINSSSASTDTYYCDLSRNWYSNGKYSYPELFPGRIIAKTQEQINNYTDKLFRYELNPGKGEFSYLRRAIYTNGYEQYVMNDSFAEIVKFYSDSIYPVSTMMIEDRQTGSPSGKDVIDEINRTQYGFINFNNHGMPTGIVMYGKGGPSPHLFKWLWAVDSVRGPASVTNHVNDETITGNGLNNMTNKYYPNICFSTCCSVNPFEVPNGYDPSWMNFGESFTTGKDYGGPAFMGNTSSNGFEMAILGQCFTNYLRKGNFYIGVAYGLSKVRSVSSYYSAIHNLLGDPEFEVWTDIPQLYSNIGITRTNNAVLISGIDADADSTIVAYYANDGRIGTDTVSSSNITINGISPNSTIMLYKHNYIPYIAPMVLQNITLENSQYVIANDVTAGNHIDNIRTKGDVVVPNDVEYEIEASGVVTLEDGFKVEKGATFAVYPSCF
jgi:hypothetical protein